jgi:predicted cupin superfamily sugar epimerase
MNSRKAADLIRELALQPHPEGGWYREIYRSPVVVQTGRGARSALTTIYYLLEATQLSRWHVVQADELWHFYDGAPLELLAYEPGARSFERRVLGPVSSSVTDAPDALGETPEADGARFDIDLTSTLHLAAPDLLAVAAQGAAVVSAIPARVWQAARSLGEYSLVGCTVGPGFEFADFEFVSALPLHTSHFTGELAPYSGLL